jgi:hypothetical protein
MVAIHLSLAPALNVEWRERADNSAIIGVFGRPVKIPLDTNYNIIAKFVITPNLTAAHEDGIACFAEVQTEEAVADSGVGPIRQRCHRYRIPSN